MTCNFSYFVLYSLLIECHAQILSGIQANIYPSSNLRSHVNKNHFPLQKRILEHTISANCLESSCEAENSFDGTSISYSVVIDSKSRFILLLNLDDSQMDLALDFEVTEEHDMRFSTEVSAGPSNPGSDEFLFSKMGINWSRSFSLQKLRFSPKYVKIKVLNYSGGRNEVFFKVSRLEGLETPESETVELWLVLVAAFSIIAFILLIVACRCMILKKLKKADRQNYQVGNPDSRIASPRHSVSQQQFPDNHLSFQHHNNDSVIVNPSTPTLLPHYDEKNPPLSAENFDERFIEVELEDTKNSAQQVCSICLEDLKSGQKYRQLYCQHVFHGECIKLWLLNQMKAQNHSHCPNCNMEMSVVPRQEVHSKKESKLE